MVLFDVQKVISTISKVFRNPAHTKLMEGLELAQKAEEETMLEDALVMAELLQSPSPVNACVIGVDVLSDLEMFNAYRDEEGTGDTVFAVLDRTVLRGSKRMLRHVLSHPISDRRILEKRQSMISAIHVGDAMGHLGEMRDLEKDVAWLFEKKEEHVTVLENMLYFKLWFLRPLNKSPCALTSASIYKILLSPMLGILSPIMYFVIPYYIIRLRYKINIGFVSYMRLMFSTSKLMFETTGWSSRLRYVSYIFSLVFYFQGIFNSVDIAKTMYQLNKFVLGRIDKILKFLEHGEALLTAAYDKDVFSVFYNASKEIPYVSLVDTPTPENRHWMFTNFGKKLGFLKNVDVAHVRTIVNQVYAVDVVNGLARLRDESGFSLCKYIDKPSPRVDAIGVWHPSISKDALVLNDMRITSRKNPIITGPNAGGKSTLVKCVLLSIVLGHTITLSNSESLSLTPCTYINSQISIPDCKGKESLFEAEMNRCKFSLDTIQNNAGFSFIVMDEIFNSTNPIEGISGAYAVAKSMTSTGNAIVMFTTHYTYLTQLAKDTKRFKNYKMEVTQDAETGAFVFPYKIQNGVSHQYIALDLLRAKGFMEDVISEATRVKGIITRV